MNMSRCYLMSVEVRKPKPSRLRDIEIAAEQEWPFTEWIWFESQKLNSSYAEGPLCGGETEKEFSHRLTKAIWKANGGYCPVKVSATCLNEIPQNEYELTRADYSKWSKTHGGDHH